MSKEEGNKDREVGVMSLLHSFLLRPFLGQGLFGTPGRSPNFIHPHRNWRQIPEVTLLETPHSDSHADLLKKQGLRA